MAFYGNTFTLLSCHPSQTLHIGALIGEVITEGSVIALIGELGTGKTRLTQGIARGLGVHEDYRITSPTFALIHEYPGRLRLVHIDAYRLSGSEELFELGYDEYLSGNNVVVIEWAEIIRDVLPEKTIYITMTYIDKNRRNLEISGDEGYIATITRVLKDGGY